MKPLEKPENAVMENESVNLRVKPSVPFTMGSTVYTKPLFLLVKCMILALPWSLTSVRMQSRMKVLMVFFRV